MTIRILSLLYMTVCLSCTPAKGPETLQGDAGACQAQFAVACENAVRNGLGAAYPGGCGQTAAEEHCR